MGAGSFLSTLSFHNEEDLDELFFGKTEIFLKLLRVEELTSKHLCTNYCDCFQNVQYTKGKVPLCGLVEHCMA